MVTWLVVVVIVQAAALGVLWLDHLSVKGGIESLWDTTRECRNRLGGLEERQRSVEGEVTRVRKFALSLQKDINR